MFLGNEVGNPATVDYPAHTLLLEATLSIYFILLALAFDFLMETNKELDIPNPVYVAPASINSDDPNVWADEIRKYLNLQIDSDITLTWRYVVANKQYACSSVWDKR